jgi:hypothetical protein
MILIKIQESFGKKIHFETKRRKQRTEAKLAACINMINLCDQKYMSSLGFVTNCKRIWTSIFVISKENILFTPQHLGVEYSSLRLKLWVATKATYLKLECSTLAWTLLANLFQEC